MKSIVDLYKLMFFIFICFITILFILSSNPQYIEDLGSGLEISGERICQNNNMSYEWYGFSPDRCLKMNGSFVEEEYELISDKYVSGGYVLKEVKG